MNRPSPPQATVSDVNRDACQYTLWYRPSRAQTWKPVRTVETHSAAVRHIGCDSLPDGDWLILAAGERP